MNYDLRKTMLDFVTRLAINMGMLHAFTHLLIVLPLPLGRFMFACMRGTPFIPHSLRYDVLYIRPFVEGYQAEEPYRGDSTEFHLHQTVGSMWISDFVHRQVKYPTWTMHVLPLVRDFPVEVGDVWVATFPKAGTTWMQHIVYLIMTKDFGNKKEQEERFPQIDFSSGVLEDPPIHVGNIAALASPRLIKTHLHCHLLPKEIAKAKVIYVARNPKDNIVSWYNFSRRVRAYNYIGTLSHTVRSVLSDEVYAAPMPEHVTAYWAQRHEPHMMFVFYEDLIEDHRGGVEKVAKFLGQTLTEDELCRIVAETSFSSMQKNPATDWKWQEKFNGFKEGTAGTSEGFYRKGKVGSWREELSQEDSDMIDRWTAARYGDIKFKGM